MNKLVVLRHPVPAPTQTRPPLAVPRGGRPTLHRRPGAQREAATGTCCAQYYWVAGRAGGCARRRRPHTCQGIRRFLSRPEPVRKPCCVQNFGPCRIYRAGTFAGAAHPRVRPQRFGAMHSLAAAARKPSRHNVTSRSRPGRTFWTQRFPWFPRAAALEALPRKTFALIPASRRVRAPRFPAGARPGESPTRAGGPAGFPGARRARRACVASG